MTSEEPMRRLRIKYMIGPRWDLQNPRGEGSWWILFGFWWFALAFSWRFHPDQISPQSRYRGFHLYWKPNEDLEPGERLWVHRKEFGWYR